MLASFWRGRGRKHIEPGRQKTGGKLRSSTSTASETRPPACHSEQQQPALSKVTLLSESNRPDWKWGTTEGGSEPSDRISSSVGSDTK